MEYRKVRVTGPKVLFIDNNGKYFKIAMNGRITSARKLPIEKEYGNVDLDILDEGAYGLRVINGSESM